MQVHAYARGNGMLIHKIRQLYNRIVTYNDIRRHARELYFIGRLLPLFVVNFVISHHWISNI